MTTSASDPICEVVNPRPAPRHAQIEYAFTLLEHIRPGIDWLDIGCGRQVVPEWVWSVDEARVRLQGTNLTGLDMDDAIDEHPFLKERLRCWADNIPVPNNSFDLVTANMMMEHVKEPAGVLQEVWRVLRPGGTFLIHTPNSRFYLNRIARLVPQFIKTKMIYWLEHREEKDIFPTVYKFNTPEAIDNYVRQSGFNIASLRCTEPTPSFLGTPLEALERPILSLLQRPEFERHRANLIIDLRKPTN